MDDVNDSVLYGNEISLSLLSPLRTKNKRFSMALAESRRSYLDYFQSALISGVPIARRSLSTALNSSSMGAASLTPVLILLKKMFFALF